MFPTDFGRLFFVVLAAGLLLAVPPGVVSTFAQDGTQTDSTDDNAESTSATSDQVAKETGKSDTPAKGGGKKKKPKYPPYHDVIDDQVQTKEGVITLHRKDDKLFAELRPSQLDRDFIVLITIARGIGQTPLVSGFSWGFGDDAVWQFRRAGERIHVVRRNVRFTAKKGSPTSRAVELAYTDSVLFSLPIVTKSASGNYVVDITPIFMSDLPQISMVLRGYRFAQDKSTWVEVNSFPKNVELQVAATYASSGQDNIETVPDTRGITVNVHYSISELPKTSYKPRLADDRVGYFLTVKRDYSKDKDDERFARYITRWNLEKSDPDAEKSPPKEPITFYLEKTIPFKYRKPIRDGILEWNQAFEEAGYYDGVSVIQQRDDDTWDPGDIRFNTFRWITADAGFAMGPSRVNPLTGEILDADIILDSAFLQYWKQDYETFTPAGIEVFTGGPVDLEGYRAQQRNLPPQLRQFHDGRCTCNLLGGVSHQYAFAATVMATRKRSPEDLDKLIMQGLKWVTMHEVGHTLGLRHNFKGSTLLSLADMNDLSKTRDTGSVASVMDYTPANIVPSGNTQGDYFTTTIGPYDHWAIGYGYTPIKAGSPEGELDELHKIAARSGEPSLAYGTDGDARGIDPDPLCWRYDAGQDLVNYARQQAKLVAEALPDIVDSTVEDGDSYERSRRAFGILLSTHGEAMFMASRYIGGLHVSRSHKGDDNAPPPFEVVSTETQRDALEMLEEQVFSDEPFHFPPELYNHLATSRWEHWGMQSAYRTDFPAHEVILMWQDRILQRLLSSLTLTRLHDSELKLPEDEDALTTAELLERLTKSIFAEVDSTDEGEYTNRTPAISSLRRNLQRTYLRYLSRLALGQTSAPQDCQTIAFLELTRLQGGVDQLLAGDVELDSYSRAHLQETSARITKVLDARMLATP